MSRVKKGMSHNACLGKWHVDVCPAKVQGQRDAYGEHSQALRGSMFKLPLLLAALVP